MKYFKTILLFVAMLVTSAALSSCGNKAGDTAQQEKQEPQEQQAQEGQTAQQGKEYTSAYICPMHCEGSGSDEPGKCPKCGMEYVKNEGHGDAMHDHDMEDGQEN